MRSSGSPSEKRQSLAHYPGRSAGGLKEAPDQRVGYQGGYFDISKKLAAKKATQKMMREIKKLHPDVVERSTGPQPPVGEMRNSITSECSADARQSMLAIGCSS